MYVMHLHFYKTNRCWKDSPVARVLTWHGFNPNSVPNTTCDPLAICFAGNIMNRESGISLSTLGGGLKTTEY